MPPDQSLDANKCSVLVNHNIIHVKSQPFLVVSSHCEAVYFPPVSFRFIHLAFHDSFGDPPVWRSAAHIFSCSLYQIGDPDKLRKDFRYGYYIGFSSGCQSASFTNSGGDFFTCTTCYRDSAKASRKRGLWLFVRVNQKDGSPCPQYTVCRLTLSLSGCQYFILTRISKNSPTSIGGEMNCHLLHSAIVGM